MKSIIFLANGIVINVNRSVKINKKSFAGININGYNINIPEQYKRDGFDDNEMYESILLCKTQFQNILKKIKEDGIEIISLTGNNGIINEKEFTAY